MASFLVISNIVLERRFHIENVFQLVDGTAYIRHPLVANKWQLIIGVPVEGGDHDSIDQFSSILQLLVRQTRFTYD